MFSAPNVFKMFERKKTPRASNSFNYSLPEFAIVFKEGAIKKIMELKGFRTKVQLADAISLCPSYITDLDKQYREASSTIITRFAALTGNINDNWHIFYELKFLGFKRHNEPKYNMEKYYGNLPYSYGSYSADLRKDDQQVEVLPIQKSS